jgi:hypothetical protein
MGIRDKPSVPRSPWQNGHCERSIGSIRRECLDHVVVFGERHLRQVLHYYLGYYNGARTHLALSKHVPISRPLQWVGAIHCTPILRRNQASRAVQITGHNSESGPHRPLDPGRPKHPGSGDFVFYRICLHRS